MPKTVNVVIDGKTIVVPEGTTILDAAKQLGIHIPTLCYHPDLKPTASCGICVVDVEKSAVPLSRKESSSGPRAKSFVSIERPWSS